MVKHTKATTSTPKPRKTPKRSGKGVAGRRINKSGNRRGRPSQTPRPKPRTREGVKGVTSDKKVEIAMAMQDMKIKRGVKPDGTPNADRVAAKYGICASSVYSMVGQVRNVKHHRNHHKAGRKPRGKSKGKGKALIAPTQAQMAYVGKRFEDEGQEWFVHSIQRTSIEMLETGCIQEDYFIHYYNTAEWDPEEDGEVPEEDLDALELSPLAEFETWGVKWV